MEPAPRLACQRCKQKKLKCDKGAPCSACRKVDLVCHAVQRTRLPRGKSGTTKTHNKLLETRVARIEALLEQQANASSLKCPISTFEPSSCQPRIPASDGSITRNVNGHGRVIGDFVAPDFWSALSAEVHGLRETLESSEDEEYTDPQEMQGISKTGSRDTGAIIFPSARQNDSGALPTPTLEAQKILLQLFRERVDSVYKIVHWPTVLATMERPTPPSDTKLSSSQALEYSIYFMALCSITDDEAKGLGLGDRPSLVQTYRATVENLYANSTLLQSPDLTLLQAFMIYLIGLRTCLNSAHAWSLVAVAARAATALRLGDELPGEFSAFDLEVRRRLLFAIGMLDTHSALDRGTVPMLPSRAFRTPPLNINDEDMLPPNHVPKASSSGPTDMSFTCLIYEAMICQRKLYELSRDEQSAWEHWPMKLDVFAAFEKYVNERGPANVESTSSIEKIQYFSGRNMLASLQLLLRRPPYRQPQNSVPPWDDFDIMENAVEVLEDHTQLVTADLAPWAWKNWVQWHALAVVLAELMVRPHGPASDRAYAVATKSFRHYASIVADSDSGMLWKPIAKLMRQVQRIKQNFHVQIAQIPLNQPITTPETLVEVAEQQPPLYFQDVDMFNFTNWNSDIYANNNAPLDANLKHNQSTETGVSHSTPWLAWDSFLQDVNDTSTYPENH